MTHSLACCKVFLLPATPSAARHLFCAPGSICSAPGYQRSRLWHNFADPELLSSFFPPPPTRNHCTASDAIVLFTTSGTRRILVGEISENADSKALEMMSFPEYPVSPSAMPLFRSGTDGPLIARSYPRRQRQLLLPRPSLITSLLFLFLCFVQRSSQDRDPVKDFCRRFGHQTAVIDRKLYIDGGLLNWNPIAQYPANYSSKSIAKI